MEYSLNICKSTQVKTNTCRFKKEKDNIKNIFDAKKTGYYEMPDKDS